MLGQLIKYNKFKKWSKNERAKVDNVASADTSNDSPDDDTSYSLTTIEEHPEIGYNSDSSETDFLIPRSSVDLGSGLNFTNRFFFDNYYKMLDRFMSIFGCKTF